MGLPFHYEETTEYEDVVAAQQRLDAHQPAAGFADLLHHRVLRAVSHAGFPGDRLDDVSAQGGLRAVGHAVHLSGEMDVFTQVDQRALIDDGFIASLCPEASG